MITRLATRSPGGQPFVTPIWFVVTGPRVVMATGEQTVSARNLRAHPEAVLLFRDDRSGGTPGDLRLRGTAAVRSGMPSLATLLQVVLKYYLAPGGLRGEVANLFRQGLRRRYYAQSRPAVIELTPASVEWLPGPEPGPAVGSSRRAGGGT